MAQKWSGQRKQPPYSPATQGLHNRSFLPPSHYAAAGGFSYPVNKRQEHKIRDTLRSYRPVENLGESGAATRVQSPRTWNTGPAQSSSESSFDSSSTEPLNTPQVDSRASNPSLVLSTRPSSTGQRQGLPNVEADLLPSLQTTIHRMTQRPPSKLPTICSTGSGTKRAQRTKETNTAMSASTPEPSRASNKATSSQETQETRGKPDSSPHELQPTRSKLPQKSNLKLALRTPVQTVQKTPMSLLPGPGTSHSVGNTPKVPSPRTPSLRSVKSLLSRRLTATTNTQQPAPTTKPSNLPTRTPPTGSTPRPKPPKPESQTHDRPTHTDESDVESRYERQWMEKRRLTVANAEVLTSTSSSESDVHHPCTPVDNWSLNANSHLDSTLTSWPHETRHDARMGDPKSTLRINVGLGLEMPTDSPLLPSGFVDKAKILRFSLPPSDSGGSLASNRRLSYPGSWDDSDYPTEREDVKSNGSAGVCLSDPRNYNSGHHAEESETESEWSGSGDDIPSSESEYLRYETKSQGTNSSSISTEPWKQRSLLSPNTSHLPPLTSPRSVSQLLSQRQKFHRDNSPCLRHSATLTPETVHNDHQSSLTPRAAREPQRSPVTPSVTPRIERTNRKPMVSFRRARGDHSWFNESSHEYNGGFDYTSPTAGRLRSPPSSSPRTKASLDEESTFHAVQERQAFGIPPSNSDEIYMGQSTTKRWSATSSYRSSGASSTAWQWDDDTPQDNYRDEDRSNLSVGAQSMLRTLKYSDPEKGASRRNMKSSASQQIPRVSVVSATSTGSSVYDDHDSETTELESEESHQHNVFSQQSRSPRSRQTELEEHTIRLVPKASGAPELTPPESRDDIIQEFMQSEERFLANAQTCITSFILPIRAQDQRSWIGGVPSNISRLLDWYEDIINLHVAIFQALETSLSTQGEYCTISGLPGYLQGFIPKMHVYQPYLVRLADVLEEIVQLVSDSNSDFGEFIRMQERSMRNSGWSFERFLMEPVHRLAAYQDMFARLLQRTPETHSEFLATFTLSKSTDTVVRVLTEVKLQENEHRLIQALASQISDASMARALPTRERHLLYSGTFRLVSPTLPLIHGAPGGSVKMDLSPKNTKAGGKKSSRLAEAISGWDRGLKRSSSIKSISSSIASPSMRSFNTTSSGTSVSILLGNARAPKLKHMFKRKPGRSRVLTEQSPEDSMQALIPPDHVQLFVFSDILLLITPRQSSSSHYDLVRGIGVSRIFSVSSEPSIPQGFTLQLIPTSRSINDGCLPTMASITSATLQMVFDSSNNTALTGHISKELDLCMKCLERCSQHTHQLISFSGFQEAAQFRSDSAKDTWLTVTSLMASGLPMPKSPSGELPDLKYGREGEDSKEIEREERGWWTLRYQQVLGELRRECLAPSDVPR